MKLLVPGIENPDAEQIKILYVARDHGEPMLQRGRRDQTIGRRDWSYSEMALRAQRAPLFRDRVGDGQYPAVERWDEILL